MSQKQIIQSYMMGGFECCDMINRYGARVDLLSDSNHISHLYENYLRLKDIGITTVREGIRWSVVEKNPNEFDWSEFNLMVKRGKELGIQQIWDICHFGMPNDLSPLHPQFLNRFVNICVAFLQQYRSIIPTGQLIVTPINEVSFFSWLGGEVGCTTPYTKGCGWDVKYALTKAYIAAIKAMRAIDEEILILTTEPLVDVLPPQIADLNKLKEAADAHELQYQVTDMLLGRICPELGGSNDLVDIIGYNFYYCNRYSIEPYEVISWTNEHNDYRFRPLSIILEEGYNRYLKPIILAETSHSEEDRAAWFQQIISETSIIHQKEIPLLGICWYPVLDRPDWDETDNWHKSGIWNNQNGSGAEQALVHFPLIDIYQRFQEEAALSY